MKTCYSLSGFYRHFLFHCSYLNAICTKPPFSTTIRKPGAMLSVWVLQVIINSLALGDATAILKSQCSHSLYRLISQVLPQQVLSCDSHRTQWYQWTVVQVMAWCHQAASHYLSQCWTRSMSSYGVSRPQWVKCQSHTHIQDPSWSLRWLQMPWVSSPRQSKQSRLQFIQILFPVVYLFISRNRYLLPRYYSK